MIVVKYFFKISDGKDRHHTGNAQLEIEKKMNGNSSRSEIGENNPPSIRTHYRNAYSGVRTTYGPTGSHERSLNIAIQMAEKIKVMIMSNVT